MYEPFIGQIQYFGFYFQIRGWAFCNGQKLPIKNNQALFSLLGTYYGGDGIQTFALPDLREFKSPGVEYEVGEMKADGKPYLKAQIAIEGIYPPRN